MRSFPNPYRDRLCPWCVIQLLPNACTVIVVRFRRRNDAEAHVKALCRLKPDAIYEIMFDTRRVNEES